MAIARQPPRCTICGEVVAKGIYKNQSHLPPTMRVFGDTFLRWEPIRHNCKGAQELPTSKLLNVQDHIDFLAQLQAEQPINMTTDNKITPIQLVTDEDVKDWVELLNLNSNTIKGAIVRFKHSITMERSHIEHLKTLPQNETTKAFIHYCQYSIEQLTDRRAEYENYVEKNEKING